jgi:glucose/arabinose dehydrogenase
MSTQKVRPVPAVLSALFPTHNGATAQPLALAAQQVALLRGAVFLTSPPGDPRQFIVQREGRIFVRENGVVLDTPFLDINEPVLSHREGGLLSMAFHPDYASNGHFFLFYTDKLHRIVIERRRVSIDPNRAEPGSNLTILRIPKLNLTHNGGQLAFGPDGYLYFATGDDGGSGDPFRNGQNLDILLAKVLRIDVNNARAGERYRIPPSNPFVGVEGARPEIWAYGVRNPWRFSFDNGLLYLGDVGQDAREEIDVVPVGQGGFNFGWRIMEGSSCDQRESCDRSGLTLPVLEYDHSEGCSVTGGYVYRGAALPELDGHYFYSDFCRGFLRSFRYANGSVSAHTDWQISAGNILSFGRDAEGELYMLAVDGRILKIVRRSALP